MSINIIPRPCIVSGKTGVFVMPKEIVIAGDESLLSGINIFVSKLKSASINVKTGCDCDATIVIEKAVRAFGLGEEGYRLEVKESQIIISAATDAGVFYACETLRQLLPLDIEMNKSIISAKVECVFIHDEPSFAWRGMHLDVCRHFLSVEYVKKFIDMLAMHKMNTLHWHLTEDQGWRVEIKKYPLLTEVGSIREKTLVGHEQDRPRKYDDTPHGGFYTQEELRDIVKYAAERYVNIMPEIDMPGHMQAAITAYPNLGTTGKANGVRPEWGISDDILNMSDETIGVMKDILSEVMDIFPYLYIHIGGDEAVKTQWKESAVEQARIKELGLKDEKELQSWFLKKMNAHIIKNGRRMVGWDEILEGGLAEDATVMSWRDVSGAIRASRMGSDAVMAYNKYTYFDYCQNDTSVEPLSIGGRLPTRRVYDYNPIPLELEPEYHKHILGGQGQLWSEYMPNSNHVEYMAFPRVCALAETLWTPKEMKNFSDFKTRLETFVLRLDALGINRYKGPLEI